MPSLEDVPSFVATFWDIPLVSAQTILSAIVLLAVLLPVFIVTRGRGPMIPAVMYIIVAVILTSISWMDSWVMILTVVVVALFIAMMGRKLIMEG